MKSEIATQIEEIANAIAFKGMDRAAIVAQFGKKWQLAPRSIDRRIESAASRISELQQELQKGRATSSIDAEVEAKKELLMTAMDKRLLLASIMRGEHTNEVKRPVFNQSTGKFEIVTYHEKPSVGEIVRAMGEDNRMVGDYAPEKKNVKHSGKIGTDSEKKLDAITAKILGNAGKP